jgi:hypothetical protein
MRRISRRKKEHIQRRWTTPGDPTAFSGLTKLAKHYDINTSTAKDLLAQIDSYTLHREGKRSRHFNPFYIYRPREQVQVDLMDMQQLADHNDNYRYIVAMIDGLTRFIWARPVKLKTATAVKNAISDMIEEMKSTDHGKPEMLFSDKGLELKNRQMQAYLQNEGITMMHPHSELKASIIERANRSIRGLIYKYMTEMQTRRYIDVLDDLIKTYNTREHRSINTSPQNAESARNIRKVASFVRERHMKLKESIREPVRFSVGDSVRILINYGRQFKRGYEEQFSEKIYKVRGVSTRMFRPIYYLHDIDSGEDVSGGFYANELQKAKHSLFKIQVLRQKRIRGVLYYFVHWLGYGPELDEWIKASDVERQY